MPRQRGFTYLALVFAVAMLSIALAGAALVWSIEARRDKERELLFVGGEFRAALAAYYRDREGKAERLPRELAELLDDRTELRARRYLRRIYYDPLTASQDWGLLKTPDGRIYGVFSKARGKPIKQAGFGGAVDAGFAGAGSYADWRFAIVALPGQTGSAGSPPGTPSEGGAASAQ